MKIPAFNLDMNLGHVPHGIFYGDNLLMECESFDDAQECMASNPAFRQMRSMGMGLKVRPITIDY